MAPFVNLFNNQLQAATVFGGNFTSSNVATLLRGIRDNPATYGLDQAAATVAGAFVNAQGLIDIIPNPIIVNGMEIRDIGAALGYLFSRQQPPQPGIEAGYRPILHAYGRVLRAVSDAIAMSAVMFDPTTSRFFYGATIPVLGTNRGRKTQVQVDRLRQLKAALLFREVSLPPFPPRTLRELARQLANVKVPVQAGANLRQAPANILRLYENLLVALVSGSNGTYPMTLTFATNTTPFNTARQNIINAELPAWRTAILAALTSDVTFRVYLEDMLRRSIGPEFGHCAESFPFIRMLRDVQPRTATQGLAMVPMKMGNLTATQITTGTTVYNQRRTFRYPCENCSEVLRLAGMTRNVFDTYIRTAVLPYFDPNVT